MASDKLQAYLAYYQKTLREDPKNIEARLRLAALFRQMNRVGHAIEEYAAASKLLAAQGLPLEAIAACKAVLELDPTHTEVQFFLAKLFAQAPGAGGQSARIAHPVGRVEPLPRQSELPDIAGFLAQAPAPSSSPHGESLLRASAPTTLPLPTLALGALAEDDLPTAVHDAVARQPHFSPSELGSLEDDFATEPLTGDRETLAREQERAFVSPHHEPTKLAQHDLLMPSLPLGEGPDHGLSAGDAELDQSLRQTQSIDPAEVLKGLLDASAGAGGGTVREASFEVGVFDLEMVEVQEIDPEALEALEALEASWSHSADITLEQDESLVQTGELPRQRVDITWHEMPKVPLFHRLSQEAFVKLLGQVRVQQVPAGQAVLEPGHGVRSLFIVVRGELEVTKKSKAPGPGPEQRVHLTRFGEGDFFGEFSLLTGLDGGATVRALRQTTVLEVTEQMIHEVSQVDPGIWDTLWEVYTFRILNNTMATHPILGHVSHEDRARLIPHFERKAHLKGQVILHPGQRCEHVSLLLFGSLSVTHPGRTEPVSVIAHGEFFGLIASLSNDPCKVQLTAREDATLLRLPGHLFRQITRQSPQVAEQIRQFLKSKHVTPEHSL